MWHLWTRDCIRDCIRQQKEAKEKDVELKTRRQDITIEPNEEIEEEELQALFPSHKDHTPRTSPSSSNLVLPVQISMLYKMDLSIMSGGADPAQSSSYFHSLRQQLVVAIVERLGDLLPSFSILFVNSLSQPTRQTTRRQIFTPIAIPLTLPVWSC